MGEQKESIVAAVEKKTKEINTIDVRNNIDDVNKNKVNQLSTDVDNIGKSLITNKNLFSDSEYKDLTSQINGFKNSIKFLKDLMDPEKTKQKKEVAAQTFLAKNEIKSTYEGFLKEVMFQKFTNVQEDNKPGPYLVQINEYLQKAYGVPNNEKSGFLIKNLKENPNSVIVLPGGGGITLANVYADLAGKKSLTVGSKVLSSSPLAGGDRINLEKIVKGASLGELEVLQHLQQNEASLNKINSQITQKYINTHWSTGIDYITDFRKSIAADAHARQQHENLPLLWPAINLLQDIINPDVSTLATKSNVLTKIDNKEDVTIKTITFDGIGKNSAILESKLKEKYPYAFVGSTVDNKITVQVSISSVQKWYLENKDRTYNDTFKSNLNLDKANPTYLNKSNLATKSYVAESIDRGNIPNVPAGTLPAISPSYIAENIKMLNNFSKNAGYSIEYSLHTTTEYKTSKEVNDALDDKINFGGNMAKGLLFRPAISSEYGGLVIKEYAPFIKDKNGEPVTNVNIIKNLFQ